MTPRREPVSRRDRPAKPPLNLDGVVSVALRIMRDEGLEKVTMRRLAAELDTGPASLYVYVANMAELHGAILDTLLAGLRPADRDSAPERWREELIAVLTEYTAVLFAHPSLARSVLTLRPTGPHYVRLIDLLLGLLHRGGVPVAQAAWGVDLLLQHGTATAAEHGTRGETDKERFVLAEALSEAGRAGHDNIARADADLFSGTASQRMTWMFEALITGIAAVKTPGDHS